MHVETSVLECEPLVLWICLVLTLAGLHIYSMVLYLLFVSCSLALQLCLGGMALVSTLNDRLPQEGVRAALAHLAVALSAPVVLVADGSADASVSLTSKRDWDLAAADIILSEAGGRLTDTRGETLVYNKPSAKQSSLIAANPALSTEIIALLRQ